jgi:hypothetical protein
MWHQTLTQIRLQIQISPNGQLIWRQVLALAYPALLTEILGSLFPVFRSLLEENSVNL